MKKIPVLLSLSVGAAALATEPSPPNILFIFSDDHSIQTIGAYESRLQKFINEHGITPNIDRLAAEGGIFPRSYCCNSICGPSRAAVLTGKHSSQNGYPINTHAAPFNGEQWTFPKALHQYGYQTALVGKWHLDSDPTGFDYWEILPGQGDYYNPIFIQETGRHQETGYVTDLITQKAIRWMEQRDPTRPFLMMCQHKAPHRTWIPATNHLDLLNGVHIPEPETLFDDYSDRASGAANQTMQISEDMKLKEDLKVIETSLMEAKNLPSGFNRMTPEQRQALDSVYTPENRAFYAANLSGQALTEWKYQRYMRDYLRCVKSVDDSVGQLLDWLDQSGLASNTIVIYSADQGFYNGEHGWFDKRWIYEESLRMPFLIRWPNVIQPGSVFQEMIQNIDYAPTFLEMAGLAAPAEVQGRSFLPILKGGHPTDWRDAIYYHYYEYPVPHQVQPHRGLRTERYTLADYYRIGEWELFDNQKDPEQLHNVYANPEYAPVVEKLKAELSEMEETFDKTSSSGDSEGKSTTTYIVSDGKISETASGTVVLTGSPVGYAIRPIPEELASARKLTLSATIDTAKQGASNGLLCFGDSSDPKNMVKCGVYSGKSEMIVLYGEFGGPEKDIIRKQAALGKDRVYQVSITVDLDTQSVQMNINGSSMTASLRTPLSSIRFVGLNSNRTTTEFKDLKIQ